MPRVHSPVNLTDYSGSSLFKRDINSLSYMKTIPNIFQSVLLSFYFCLWKFLGVEIFTSYIKFITVFLISFSLFYF